jgi:hypothetical protein
MNEALKRVIVAVVRDAGNIEYAELYRLIHEATNAPTTLPTYEEAIASAIKGKNIAIAEVEGSHYLHTIGLDKGGQA